MNEKEDPLDNLSAPKSSGDPKKSGAIDAMQTDDDEEIIELKDEVTLPSAPAAADSAAADKTAPVLQTDEELIEPEVPPATELEADDERKLAREIEAAFGAEAEKQKIQLSEDAVVEAEDDEALFSWDPAETEESRDEANTTAPASETETLPPVDDEIIEITEFDEQFPEDDAETFELDATEKEADADDLEFLELIDVEDENSEDNETTMRSDSLATETAQKSPAQEQENVKPDRLAAPAEEEPEAIQYESLEMPGKDEQEVIQFEEPDAKTIDTALEDFFGVSREEEISLDYETVEEPENAAEPPLREDESESEISLTDELPDIEEFDFNGDTGKTTDQLHQLDTFLFDDSRDNAADQAVSESDRAPDEDLQPDMPPQAPPADEQTAYAAPAAAAGALSAAQLEAAVERVLEHKLAGKIEQLIAKVIEKAVSREIERLKALLLEDSTHQEGI